MSQLTLYRNTETVLKEAVFDTTGAPVSTAVVTLNIYGPGAVYLVQNATMVWTPANSDYEYTIPAASLNPTQTSAAGFTTTIDVTVSGVQKLHKVIPTLIPNDSNTTS